MYDEKSNASISADTIKIYIFVSSLSLPALSVKAIKYRKTITSEISVKKGKTLRQ